MENMVSEAREVVKKLSEKLEPAAENIRESAQQAAEKIKDAARDISNKIAGAVPGGEIKNDFFDGLEAEAAGLKASAAQKADDLQKKLEALMRGEDKQ